MERPLVNFFEDLTDDRRNRILNLVESLPEDVQSVIFPKTTYMTVSDPIGTPLATYWVDMDAVNVLQNLHNLRIDISPYFSYYSLPEILTLLKGHSPEEYLEILTPTSKKGFKAVKTAIETYELFHTLTNLLDELKDCLPN